MSGDSSIQSSQIRKLDFKPQDGSQIEISGDKASFTEIESSKNRAGDLRTSIKSERNFGVNDNSGINSSSKSNINITGEKGAWSNRLNHDEIYSEINDFYKLATGRVLI